MQTTQNPNIVLSNEINETFASDVVLKATEIANEPLASFSPKQKQTLMRIFEECHKNLENLSK